MLSAVDQCIDTLSHLPLYNGYHFEGNFCIWLYILYYIVAKLWTNIALYRKLQYIGTVMHYYEQ